MSSDPVSTQAATLHRRLQEHLRRSDWKALDADGRRLLALVPRHADAHFLLGLGAAAQGRLGDAMRWFQASMALDGTRHEYPAQLANCLSKVHRLRDAVLLADQVRARQPSDASTLSTLGAVYSRGHEHHRAAEAFREAVGAAPGHPGHHFNLGISLTALADFDAAEAAFEAAIALDPHHWAAHSSLAQLRRWTPDRHHLERLRTLLPSAATDADGLLHLHLALSKELEDLEDFQGAFRHLVAGKSAKRATLSPTHDEHEKLVEALIERFPDRTEQPIPGFETAQPIFVVGLPRTGTTLVDRILSSHPQVVSVGESPNFGMIIKRAAQTRSTKLLDVETLDAVLRLSAEALGRAYMEQTRPREAEAGRFVDKTPLNFLYAGLIARCLPQAKVICLRRHPLDTCLSNFRQLFAPNNPNYFYAYDLLDSGRYYLAFDRLIAHWRKVLPGRFHEVHYESLVRDQEAETRRLLALCDLDWDPACLAFEHNPLAVSTASAVQVRQPLYTSSLERWRRYENELAPLRAFLQNQGIEPG